MTIKLYTLSAAIGTTHKVIVAGTEDCYLELITLLQLGALNHQPSEEMQEFLESIEGATEQGVAPEAAVAPGQPTLLDAARDFLYSDKSNVSLTDTETGLQLSLWKGDRYLHRTWVPTVEVTANTRKFELQDDYTAFLQVFEWLVRGYGSQVLWLWVEDAHSEVSLHTVLLGRGYKHMIYGYLKVLTAEG